MRFSIRPLSLKVRLNLLITLLLCLILLIGAMQLVINSRNNVRAEIESTVALVSHLLDAELERLARTGSYHAENSPIDLEKFHDIRHFKISFFNRAGDLVQDSTDSTRSLLRETAPSWFSGLMERVDLRDAEIRRVVTLQDVTIGSIVITPDPTWEIAEVWDDTVSLLGLVALFFFTVNILVYWAVASALKPVDKIWAALNELERGNLDARLPSFRLPELCRISEKFNHMAHRLQQSIGRNHRLSQQLIRLQEEERKNLARDLHDELGQSLTAIRMDGSALLELSRVEFPAARASAQAIVDVTHQVMQQIRAMLLRLRPEVLDGLGLHAALVDMTTAWSQRHGTVTLTSHIGLDIDSVDDTANITAYRVVQECLTNISRHATPRNVTVSVRRRQSDSGSEYLDILVDDDGRGFDPDSAQGLGLSGMCERVEGIGGEFTLKSIPGRGTRVRATVPLRELVS